MIQFGSLVGFALVFLLVAWTTSTGLTFLLWAIRPWLRNLGPAAERRAVELVSGTPVVFAATVVLLLTLQSLLDSHHCDVHSHHAHLCLLHGAAWTTQGWAVTLVSGAAALMLVRYARLAVALFYRYRSLALLRSVSQRADGIWWVDSTDALCFVSGVRRPEIFISRGTWETLDEDERIALLAHEQAHIRQGDVIRGLMLEILLLTAAPFSSLLRRAWDCATERLCDARAAAEVGRGTIVANAMVKLCRLGITAPQSATSFTPKHKMLATRVGAVLAEGPAGDRAANILWTLGVITTVAVIFVAALHTSSLHHFLETLLG